MDGAQDGKTERRHLLLPIVLACRNPDTAAFNSSGQQQATMDHADHMTSCLPSVAVTSSPATASTSLPSEPKLSQLVSTDTEHSNNGVRDVGLNGTRLADGEAPHAHDGVKELGSGAQHTISARMLPTAQRCTGSAAPASNPESTPGNDSNLSSPRTQRKKIKKREFGFFYADDKKQHSASSSENPPVGETEAIATNTKKRKRSRHVPVKDSLLIEVPMSITADMGVAMRRTRRKRTERIKNWLATGEDAKKQQTTTATAPPKQDDEDDGDKSIEGCSFDEDGGPKRGSIEYLEAKYVRGVMIDDYDERAAKESEESEGDGSVYGNDDFIDDSLLQEEVAGQVLASSTYGRTQMEEEQARRRLEEQNKKAEADSEIDAAGGPKIEGLEGSDDESVGSSNTAVYDKAFDDGFFVNVGKSLGTLISSSSRGGLVFMLCENRRFRHGRRVGGRRLRHVAYQEAQKEKAGW